jgi:hypothetical protein
MESVDSVRDILEVFGAFDRAVGEAKDDPEVLAAADKLLPGSAANHGWYDELKRRYFPSDADKEPNLGEALKRIAKADEQADTDEKKKRLTRAQKARLLYGIAATAALRHVAPKSSLPAFDQPDDSEFGEALIGSLAAIAPTATKTVDERRAKAKQARNPLVQHVSSNFTCPEDFRAVRAKAEEDIRSNEKLLAPLCQTAVVTVDGFESAIVDTKFTSDTISLERLKSIVNPFNWAQDYAELFVRMQGQEPDIMPDGWRRVLETVRLLGSEELTTPLKFYPSQDPKRLGARLDYDLDMSRFETGDRQVRVDRGFINMKVTNGAGDPTDPGVLVTTRKVVHIQGISAFAQAKLVCIGGYGTASADFLLGAAAKEPKNPKPFEYPTNDDEADTAQDTAAAPPATAMTHFAPAAVDAWTECAQDLTNGYFDVAQKWLSGSLTLTDLADYTTRVGGEFASAPWKYLQAMTTPRTPGKPGGAE